MNPKRPLCVDILFDSVGPLDELAAWQDFRVEQIDDYYGIANEDDHGDDVAVWFFPLRAGEVIEHSPEMPDGVRLSFDVLRNRADKAELFLKCLSAFAEAGREILYEGQPMKPPFEPLRHDLDTLLAYWRGKGIEVGTDEALSL